MAGYVYITGARTDPGLGHTLNDPIFTKPPTLGACMPNLRRFVKKGDFIFVVSGSTPGVSQYVIGGFRVEEKIHALIAHERFPSYRLQEGEDDQTLGNIICTPDGKQHPLDHHSIFESRLENYIIGKDPVTLTTQNEINKGRQETLTKLSEIKGKKGNRVIDVIGRMSKFDDDQAKELYRWISSLKD